MAQPWRDTGISVVGEAPWATHFCYFFDTKQDLLDILIPYFHSGLKANELCIWIVFDPLTRHDAVEGLRPALPDIDERIRAGDILIVTHAEWYLADGTLDLGRAMERWRHLCTEALERGYSGLRVNGNEAWLREEDWQSFAEYETKLNQIIRGKQILLLCTYPLRRTAAGELFDVARTHDFLIARKNGEWQVLQTAELRQAHQKIAAGEQIEGELRKQKEILQRIFDNVPLMISFIGADCELLLVNPEVERKLGWNLTEIRTHNIDILAEVYPDPEERRRAENVITEATGDWEDFRVHTRSGQIIDMSWSNVRLSDGTVISIGQDITARKRTEESLRATTEQLRALTARLQSAREEEAARIAREIHDELGSALTTLRWNLESLLPAVSHEVTSSHAGPTGEKIESMILLVDTTIQTIRRIASDLRPRILDDLGLAAAIEWQAQQFQARTGILCSVESSIETANLTREQSTAVFRILQEALTNVLRHAQASDAEITITEQRGEFVLTIYDNGKGITAEQQHGRHSLGIVGMQERANLVGGVVQIRGGESGGTVVTVRMSVQT
jgi:PAS domain S-box-containing protein